MANSNQEIIEARLATYVDGELDAAERMEIEAHLEQNPQYRRMVEELRTGRELLRGLPRESAPLELAEAFTSQLERSVLLDGGGEPVQPRMRIGAWQQIMAAAAIVFLTLGLATIVYYVLPGHGRVVATGNPAAHPLFKAKGESSNPDATGEKRALDEQESLGKGDNRSDETRPAAPSSAADQPTPADRTASGGGGEGVSKDRLEQSVAKGRGQSRETLDETRKETKELDQLARNVSQDRAVIDLLAAAPAENAKAGKAGAVGGRAMVLVVRSNNPQQVSKELNEYCRDRKIDLQAAPQLTALALNMSAVRESDRLLRKAEIGGDAEADSKTHDIARRLTDDEKKPGNVALADALPPGQGRPVASPRAAGQPKPASPAQSSKGTSPVPDKPKAAAKELGRADTAKLVPAPPQGGNSGIQPTTQFAKVVEEKQGIKLQEELPNERFLYVARRISRQDAQAINACLARNGYVSQAAIVHPGGESVAFGNAAGASNQPLGNKGAAHIPPAPVAADPVARTDFARTEAERFRDGAAGPATAPASDVVVQKGDELRLRYQPGKDATERAETVIVKADGTIEPQILAEKKSKVVQVAGKTLSEVEKALEQNVKYEGAALAGPVQGPVKVSILSQDDDIARAPAAPGAKTEAVTTQPAATFAAKEAEPRRSVPSSTVAAAPPHPTTGLSGSDADLVDVLIVVQSDAPPTPAENVPAAAPIGNITPSASSVPATAPATQPGPGAPQTPAKPAN